MNQIVKLQISSNLEDVPRISSITLEEALLNINFLQEKILSVKKNLKNIDLNEEEDRELLKKSFDELNETNFLLSKIDIRVGDVASIIGGLISIFENKQSEQKEEQKDDNITARFDTHVCLGSWCKTSDPFRCKNCW